MPTNQSIVRCKIDGELLEFSLEESTVLIDKCELFKAYYTICGDESSSQSLAAAAVSLDTVVDALSLDDESPNGNNGETVIELTQISLSAFRKITSFLLYSVKCKNAEEYITAAKYLGAMSYVAHFSDKVSDFYQLNPKDLAINKQEAQIRSMLELYDTKNNKDIMDDFLIKIDEKSFKCEVRDSGVSSYPKIKPDNIHQTYSGVVLHPDLIKKQYEIRFLKDEHCLDSLKEIKQSKSLMDIFKYSIDTYLGFDVIEMLSDNVYLSGPLISQLLNNIDYDSKTELYSIASYNIFKAGLSALHLCKNKCFIDGLMRCNHHRLLLPSIKLELVIVSNNSNIYNTVETIYNIVETTIKRIHLCMNNAVKSKFYTRAEFAVYASDNDIEIHVNYDHNTVIRAISYKNIADILVNTDVDSSCMVYDGKEIWTSPRGYRALTTKCNIVNPAHYTSHYARNLCYAAARGYDIRDPGFTVNILNDIHINEDITDNIFYILYKSDYLMDYLTYSVAPKYIGDNMNVVINYIVGKMRTWNGNQYIDRQLWYMYKKQS